MDSAETAFSSNFQDRFFREGISHLLTDQSEACFSAVPEQNRTEQNRTEQNRTEQNRTEQNRTEQNRTEQNRMNPQSPRVTIFRL